MRAECTISAWVGLGLAVGAHATDLPPVVRLLRACRCSRRLRLPRRLPVPAALVAPPQSHLRGPRAARLDHGPGGAHGRGGARVDRRRPPRSSTPVFRKTFQGMLQHGYGRCEHLWTRVDTVARRVDRGRTGASLADLNIAFIDLALRPPRHPAPKRCAAPSSARPVDGRLGSQISSGRLEAKRYLAAAGSRDYMIEDGVFPLASVVTSFQDYEPVEYPQLGGRPIRSPTSRCSTCCSRVGPERALSVIRRAAGRSGPGRTRRRAD